MARYETIEEAARAWLNGFNAIPTIAIEHLYDRDYDSLTEITPPCVGDRVCMLDSEHFGTYGYIIKTNYDDEKDLYEIQLEGEDETAILSKDELDVQRDGFLPMWGTMWSFGDKIDDWWFENRGGLQSMADCGFRIYEQDDFGYIFGIDGGGYDFYESHWIPLYKARGLHWHKENKEVSA